jgi:hypothetical protein
MEAMATQFFQDLYSADPNVKPEEVLNMFEPVITTEINHELCKPLSDEEISDVLFQIGSLKSPGLDGFPGRFFSEELGAIEIWHNTSSAGLLSIWGDAAGS